MWCLFEHRDVSMTINENFNVWICTLPYSITSNFTHMQLSHLVLSWECRYQLELLFWQYCWCYWLYSSYGPFVVVSRLGSSLQGIQRKGVSEAKNEEQRKSKNKASFIVNCIIENCCYSVSDPHPEIPPDIDDNGRSGKFIIQRKDGSTISSQPRVIKKSDVAKKRKTGATVVSRQDSVMRSDEYEWASIVCVHTGVFDIHDHTCVWVKSTVLSSDHLYSRPYECTQCDTLSCLA